MSQPLAGDGSAEIDSASVGVRRPGPATRAIAQFVFLAAVGAMLSMFHGISLHLTPWSQAIVNGVVKYAYPPTGQADTTVVLFREENLAELGESFPYAQMDVERGVSGVLTYAHGGGGAAFGWTPAFAMYDVFARVEAKPRLSPADAQPMEIIWGNLASGLNESWMHCRSEGALPTSSTSSGRIPSRPSGRVRTPIPSRCSTSSGPTTPACRRRSRRRRSSTEATFRWSATV